MTLLLDAAPHPVRRMTLVVLLAAAVMNLLDGTILNVALPSIAGDLQASSSQVKWISVLPSSVRRWPAAVRAVWRYLWSA
jgi:hypothetical protein